MSATPLTDGDGDAGREAARGQVALWAVCEAALVSSFCLYERELSAKTLLNTRS